MDICLSKVDFCVKQIRVTLEFNLMVFHVIFNVSLITSPSTDSDTPHLPGRGGGPVGRALPRHLSPVLPHPRPGALFSDVVCSDIH